ncbi:MAG: 50S ribosomal protein L25 [Candidatus Falkowbacteria bacterium]|nr:50S ribosomal protein L25 [Candidatus Falkowbacteria bacterium]
MDLKLTAELRADKEKIDQDSLPAVLYGKGRANANLKLKINDFIKIFKTAGESNLVELNIGTDAPVKVLIKDVQFELVKDLPRHVDFYQVNMKEKIRTEIPLHFIGESKAVKELGGVFLHEITEVEVECLPSDLSDHIDVDISVLNTYDDEIRMQDLKLPAGMKLVHDTNDIVAQVAEPKVEVEAPVEVAAPVEAPKAEEKTEEETKKK